MKAVASILSIATVSLFAACSNNPNNTPVAKAKTNLGTATAGDLTVELLTDDKLETGLTPIYIKVTAADGRAVTDANVTFVPLMSMSSGTKHSAPVIGKPAIDTDNLYHGSVVFQMASSDMGTWSATVGINDSDAETNDASFADLSVSDSGRAQVFTYTDSTTLAAIKYVSSLNFTSSPKVGLNPIVFTLHKMQDMMTFQPIDDATIGLDPQMPSMGHGSPGSVDPTVTSLGRYDGQLSFSMAGTWDTTVTVSQGSVALGTPKFTTTF
jgi:hypothetical protein